MSDLDEIIDLATGFFSGGSFPLIPVTSPITPMHCESKAVIVCMDRRHLSSICNCTTTGHTKHGSIVRGVDGISNLLGHSDQ